MERYRELVVMALVGRIGRKYGEAQKKVGGGTCRGGARRRRVRLRVRRRRGVLMLILAPCGVYVNGMKSAPYSGGFLSCGGGSKPSRGLGGGELKACAYTGSPLQLQLTGKRETCKSQSTIDPLSSSRVWAVLFLYI